MTRGTDHPGFNGTGMQRVAFADIPTERDVVVLATRGSWSFSAIFRILLEERAGHHAAAHLDWAEGQRALARGSLADIRAIVDRLVELAPWLLPPDSSSDAATSSEPARREEALHA